MRIASSVVRAVIARSLGGAAAAEFARARWGAASEAAQLVTRAGVTGIDSSDLGTPTGQNEFFGSVQGALPFANGAWRKVQFNIRHIAATSGSTAAFIAESKAIPVSRPALDGSTLPVKKIGGIVIQTMETLTDPLSEVIIEDEQRTAAVGAITLALLDPDNAGSASTPKAITHSTVAVQIAATGDPAADIASAVEGFEGDLSAAIWLLDPLTAAQLALARDTGGNYAFPDIGPRGGSILKIPAYTFKDIPRDSTGGLIALVDPSRVSYAFDNIEITRSTSANIECDDAPTGASDVPTASSAHTVNLFQADLVAQKLTARTNWKVERSGAVVALLGTNYTAP